MTHDQFLACLEHPDPPKVLNDELRALWRDAKGDWEGAHRTVQDLQGQAAARIHAYLHRKEGDLSNARYWYERAGAQVQRGPLADEWQQLVRELL